MRESRRSAGSGLKRLVLPLVLLLLGMSPKALAQKRATRPPAAKPESAEERLGRMFTAIVSKAAAITGGKPQGIFIYAETADDWMHVSVLKETPKRVTRFVIPDESQLPTLILMLRDTMMLKPKDKWSVMELEVAAGNQFILRTRFPDEVRVAPDSYVLRNARLKARFKDKPIVGPFAPRWKVPPRAEGRPLPMT